MLVLMLHVCLSVGTYWHWMVPFGTDYVDPSRFVTNLRLVQGLAVGYVIWFLLVFQRRLAPETGQGLVLASFGVHCRVLADLAMYGLEWTRGPHAMGPPYPEVPLPLEADPGSSLGVLSSALHHGGLLAYILGFALILAAAWADVRRRARFAGRP
ncbi:MAG: hypothetical protein ACYTFD_15610 [Planctomycetota bacterium]